MHLHDLTIKKFHEGLLKKDFSALEITQATFDWIERRDREIGAYLSLSKDSAVKQAEAADIKVAKNNPISCVEGLPIALKDNILVEGLPATAGSKILEAYRASYDATVSRKLKDAGAVFLGKANCDEFAMGSSGENSGFKVTKNPLDLERVPGGSSSGSTAAVADHMAVAALGSDTGGSIRQPAAFCGIVGLKPTYGSVSRYGLIALASSLDQIGPLTKTVEDAAFLFKEIAGHDPLDSTSSDVTYGEDLINPRLEDIKKLRVGIPEEYFIKGLDEEVSVGVENAIADIKGLGLEIKKIRLPHTKYALSCYYIIMPAEASSNLERFDGIRYGTRHKAGSLLDLYRKNREAGFGAEPKRRILLGNFVLSSGYYDAYYSKAQKVRQLIKRDFDEAFKEVDVIATPVTPTRAFKIGEKSADPLEMYLSDIFTIPVNLAGLPALSIPVKKRTGLPVGFQLIGRRFREADILGIGQFYEKLYN